MPKFFLSIFLILGIYLISPNLLAQTLTREEVKESIQEMPSFSIYQNNYFITGIPTNEKIDSQNADSKYQISFKQLVTRKALLWDTHLYVTYSQKAFWNIFEFSSPFQEINFNPSAGLQKIFYNKNDRVSGKASLMLNHNSNGRDSIYSRSWNSLNFKYTLPLNTSILMSAEVWAPFMYKDDNPDLFEYIGVTKLSFSYAIKPDKLYFDISAQKGLNWDWKGSIKSSISYNLFNSKNQYVMLEWFAGHGESLVNYDKFTSMVRIGYVLKSDEFLFLRSSIK